MLEPKDKSSLHIAMYPWLAMGHITSFLHLANKLAERGHKITFFLPPRTQPKLAPLNHHPGLISFIPIPVPRVDGLPDGAETTNDVPRWAQPLIMTAMDLTREPIEAHLARLRPDIVFFDFTEWLPGLARKYRAKSVYYATTFMFPVAYLNSEARDLLVTRHYTFKEADVASAPPGFPAEGVGLLDHEARAIVRVYGMQFGGGMTLVERHIIAGEECDAIAYKTCREMEGPFCEFVAKHKGKPLLLAGPVVPGRPDSRPDEEVDGWLKRFGEGSVVYCAFGSECALEKEQFQELVLGLELTGRPFLAALKPPRNCETIESALPEGFLERTKDRGMIHGGWVQQLVILHHPSVGCFVTHCGAGSLSEAMMSECQLVMLPQAIDQFLNARFMSSYLRAGVEVEKRENDGFFTKESVRKAINSVMEEESEVGKEVRANHAKWREVLSTEGLEESYINELVEGLQDLLE